MVHGTLNGYQKWRCRCDECRAAAREYYRQYNAPPGTDEDAISDLLHELFPYGLTPECPAARARAA